MSNNSQHTPSINADTIQWLADVMKHTMKIVKKWRDQGEPDKIDYENVSNIYGDATLIWSRAIYLIYEIISFLDLSKQLLQNASYNVPLLERLLYGRFVHLTAKNESEEDVLYNAYKIRVYIPLALVSLIWTAKTMNYALESLEILVEYVDLDLYDSQESLKTDVLSYLEYILSLDSLDFDDSDWLDQS